ncbi:protein of unknown function (plasmid) [Rhodovastum atsumiense]|nr:protein of unknown function [Rhodovastum atsumiense]
MRGRGSKHRDRRHVEHLGDRRPPCEGVDRNFTASGEMPAGCGRPPCEGVDRNTQLCVLPTRALQSPSVRGRGSKPLGQQGMARRSQVALRARAWIET